MRLPNEYWLSRSFTFLPSFSTQATTAPVR